MKTMYCVVLKDGDERHVCGSAYIGESSGPAYFPKSMGALRLALELYSTFPTEDYEVVKAVWPDANSIFDTYDRLPLLVFSGE